MIIDLRFSICDFAISEGERCFKTCVTGCDC